MAELDSTPKVLQSLYGWYAEDKLWVNRRYQRKLVWTLEEKQRLVESVLRGYPIPAILLAEREAGGYEVIDGLQRLHTLMSFVETAFPSIDGRFFDIAQFTTAHNRSSEGAFVAAEAPDRLSAREVGTFLDYSMPTSVMRGATDREIDEVFSRINSYGHRLSDQERRQAGVRNSFARLVRDLSSSIRGDASRDTLTLAEMPQISIDLPQSKHGYVVLAGEVFWVVQGILRSTDLRDSMDEQCVADIAASVMGGEIIDRSRDALDAIYSMGSSESKRIEDALTSYGDARFSAELKFVIQEVQKICDADQRPKLRTLLFSPPTTNAFPAVFTVLAIALHELLIGEERKIADYAGAQNALKHLNRRIDTSRGSTSKLERRRNVNTIKGLIAPYLVPAVGRSLYDDQTVTDIEDAIRRSEVEAPHYELKQGILRLDADRSPDPDILEKLVETLCGIANNGFDRTGALILGVADKLADKERVESIYSTRASLVGRKHVVGVRREAEALGESMETYVGRITTAIENSELSEPLKSAVLAGVSFNDYFGQGILVLNVPPQHAVSSVGGRVFARKADSTVEVAGTEIVDVANRFRS